MGESLAAGGVRERARAFIDAIYGMDTRAIAIFRIALGLLLFFDIADRATDLVQYTDAGAFPREYMSTSAGRPSLHALSGAAWWEGTLFALHALGALAVTVGWRPRWALGLVWILIGSLHTRHPHVLYGGDIELRLLCFWGLFLPLGARWSIDAWRSQVVAPARVLSVGTAALVWQICWIYISTVDLKTGADWHNGEAIWYALQIDHFSSPFGRWLLNFPKTLKLMSHATFWFEAVGPWLVLLVPLARVRTAVVLGFIGLHLGFEACMEIGLFPEISAVGWLPLLPALVWDGLRLPQTHGPTWRPRWHNQVLAGLALVYISWWNLGSMYPDHFSVRGDWRRPANLLRIDQYWDMFAPKPLRDDGWWILQGNRVDGTTVDLQRGGRPVDFAKPPEVNQIYPNERWRKYMRNLWNKDNARYRKPFAMWLCNTYNSHAAPKAKLESIQLIYMREDTQPLGTPITVKEVKVGLHVCPGMKRKKDAGEEQPAAQEKEPG